MTAYTYSSSETVTTTTPRFSLVNGDSLQVLANASLVQTVAVAGNGLIRTAGTTTTVDNAGYLSSLGNAVFNNSGGLQLTNSGYIQGGTTTLPQRTAAVYVEEGGVTITNSGSIVSNAVHAIVNAGSTATIAVNISNSGVIASYGGVAAIVTTWTSPTLITNTGLISGGIGWDIYNTGSTPKQAPLTLNNGAKGVVIGDIVRVLGTEAGLATTSGSTADTITNDGTIVGAVRLGLGVDSFTNSGVVVGSVDLGVGGDTYTATGTGSVTGAIIGGQGDDFITGALARDVIYGDNISGDTTGGGDTLLGGYGDDIIYGGYGVDTLYGNQDNDVLYGNQDNDVLYGGQGNDVLYGGQGNDLIVGGAGDDVLYGNLGDDTFTFSGGFGHDTLADLGAASGNADKIRFLAGTFADFADVQAHATQQGGGVLLTDAAGDTLLIVGASTTGLTSGQFIFG